MNNPDQFETNPELQEDEALTTEIEEARQRDAELTDINEG